MIGDDSSSLVDELAESFEDLYEHAPCGLVSTTVDGVIARVNETFLKWTGYRREEVVGVPFVSLLQAGSQLLYETRYLPVLHLDGEALEVALELRHVDGVVLPVLVNGTLVDDENGRPRAMRLAVFGSSARRGYERELLAARRLAESSESHVRTLQDASSSFASAVAEGELADALARSAREAFSASGVAVYLLGDDGSLGLASDEAAPGFPSSLDGDGDLAESAMRAPRTIVVSRADAYVSEHPALRDAMREARAETVSVVPLLAESKPLGVIVSSFGRARSLDASDIELHEALARQAAQVLTRIRLQARLERLALYDQLTGLASRRVIGERLVDAMSYARLSGRSMALIFLDLDGFKAINDELGHVVGDGVLTQIGERLSSVVRRGDVVGRFGGDEFVVICQDADAGAVDTVTERLHAAIREPLAGRADESTVTASIGVAVFSGSSGSGVSADIMFERADEAMYRSKRGGKNRTTTVVVG